MKRAIVLMLISLPLLSCGNGSSSSSSTSAGTINTSLTNAVTQTGIQVVTPASMQGINFNEVLTIDVGASVEQVTVTNITATTFTANFLRAHPAGTPVTGIPVVNTALMNAITSTGSQTATPISIAGFVPGQTVAVDSGSNFEEVTVSSVSGTTFTANFTKTHAAGVLVSTTLTNPGSGTAPTTGTVSHIKKRVFLSNAFASLAGALEILDSEHDLFFGNQISLDVGAGQEVLSPDKSATLVFQSGPNSVAVINNTNEVSIGTANMPGFSDSMVFGSSTSTFFVAVRNATVTGSTPGQIQVVNTASLAITSTINVPLVRTLVRSHNGNKLLAFADESDTVYYIDTTASTPTAVAISVPMGAKPFDRPVYAVFSSDDSTAYVLNCGPECGGTQASVTPLTMSSLAPGTPLPVSAATFGVLDSNGNLYVAGSPSGATGAGAGKLDVVNTGNMTVSKSGVAISDGYHNVMALNNGKLWIGARTCSSTASCLTIFDTSAQTASVVPLACSTFSADIQCSGDVTAIQPIAGRTVVYVNEGGELRILDSTTGAAQQLQIDVVGKAIGLVAPDQ